MWIRYSITKFKLKTDSLIFSLLYFNTVTAEVKSEFFANKIKNNFSGFIFLKNCYINDDAKLLNPLIKIFD